MATRPILVAARLRAIFERLGYSLTPSRPGAGAGPLDAFRLVIAPHDTGAWVVTDVGDALPDELGRLLSQELRATATTVGWTGDVTAVEVAEHGRAVRSLAVNGATVLDGEWPELLARLSAGRAAALASLGLAGFDLDVTAAAALPRAVALDLVPPKGKGEVIEIDPELSCPLCRQAMRRVTGPHGVFYGCIRFPDCKGRLTAKAAGRPG